MKLRKFCIGISAAALMMTASPLAFAQNNKPISLQDAISVGIQTNPEYGVVAASRRATDEELRQARGLYLPSVDVSGDTGFEHSDDPGTRAGPGDDEENLYRYEIGVTLTQLLFDGFETKYEIEQQKARVLSSANRVRETAEFVGLAIVESYLDVLRQRELLQIARDNVEAHLRILNMIQDGVTGGRSTQSDVEQVNARLARARADEADAMEALRIAESTYRREVGDMPDELITPVVPFDALKSNVEDQVLQSIAYSPTLDVFEADIEAAHAVQKESEGIFYPQLDLQLNARTGEDLGGVEGEDTSASALVVMNWNLYRGGIDSALRRELIHRHQQTKEERAEASRNVEQSVRENWATMVSAGERARQFAAQAAANVEVARSYMDQFQLNRRTLLDVLDAQSELFVSRSNAVNARFLENVAVYTLLGLEGNLLPTMGVDYPRESAMAARNLWGYEEKMDAR